MNWRLALSRLWVVYAVGCAAFVSILKYDGLGEYISVWAFLTFPILVLIYGVVWIADGLSSSEC